MRRSTLVVGATLLVLILGPPNSARAGTLGLELNNAGNNAMGGVYVGSYNFTLTAGSQQTQVQLVCDDFKDDVYPGESWNANTSTFPSLSNVLFTGANETRNYEEVGWLMQQMYSPANSGNAETVGDIQWAIWDIFDPNVSNNDPWGTVSAQDQCNINGNGANCNPNSGKGSWLAQAQANYGSSAAISWDEQNLVTYTPATLGQGEPQEYFGVDTPQPMPEPMTLWSLLIVLAAIAVACKWTGKATLDFSLPVDR
jgi:hypothetical protein